MQLLNLAMRQQRRTERESKTLPRSSITSDVTATCVKTTVTDLDTESANNGNTEARVKTSESHKVQEGYPRMMQCVYESYREALYYDHVSQTTHVILDGSKSEVTSVVVSRGVYTWSSIKLFANINVCVFLSYGSQSALMHMHSQLQEIQYSYTV